MNSISKKDWNLFVNTGEISDQLISYIVNKIKNNITLTDQELSIYIVHSQQIENLLKKFNSKI